MVYRNLMMILLENLDLQQKQHFIIFVLKTKLLRQLEQ